MYKPPSLASSGTRCQRSASSPLLMLAGPYAASASAHCSMTRITQAARRYIRASCRARHAFKSMESNEALQPKPSGQSYSPPTSQSQRIRTLKNLRNIPNWAQAPISRSTNPTGVYTFISIAAGAGDAALSVVDFVPPALASLVARPCPCTSQHR